MDLLGLLKIIKEEKLYEFTCFQIGPPNSSDNIGTGSSEPVTGIFEIEEGVWRRYFVDERGVVKLRPDSYTKEEAYEELLKVLRREKQLAIEYKHGKIGYHFMNKDKWW